MTLFYLYLNQIKILMNLNQLNQSNQLNQLNQPNQNNNHKIYNIINHYGEFLYDNKFNNIDSKIKNEYIVKFKELHLDGLFNYYKITNRHNLLDFNFVTMKIAEKLKNDNISSQFTKLIGKTNNGLQLMLWDILCPDDIEIS